MQFRSSRRRFLAAMGTGVVAFRGMSVLAVAASDEPGVITGDPFGDPVGRRILADGGNAVDAIIAGAFVACVTNLPGCGIGGYGGHLTVGLPNGRVESIDFNSTAPLAVTRDFFAGTQTQGGYNQRGWLSAGVPGVLHGMQLAVEKFGTRTLGDLLQPAIDYARNGFPLPESTARTITRLQKQLVNDEGSARLLLPNGKPPVAGSTFRNPDLAMMLDDLAKAGNVEPFYRGRFGRDIAAAFKQNGGLVSLEDLARYRARVVRPAHLRLDGNDIYTAPLTAGGITSLHILKLFNELSLNDMPPGPAKLHTQVEAQRIAWHDRLTNFGDPEFVDVIAEQFLSDGHIREQAGRVRSAVQHKRRIEATTAAKDHGGTCHMCAADRTGMMAAMTFTHGQGFGSLVTVNGLGLTLGHGVSRFDPNPNHPNSPGPGKRPLNNMCPTIVVRNGRPVAAIGGRGGRKIPNAVACALMQAGTDDFGAKKSVLANRLHTEGDTAVTFQGDYSDDSVQSLKALGYSVGTGSIARLDAVSYHSGTGEMIAAFK